MTWQPLRAHKTQCGRAYIALVFFKNGHRGNSPFTSSARRHAVLGADLWSASKTGVQLAFRNSSSLLKEGLKIARISRPPAGQRRAVFFLKHSDIGRCRSGSVSDRVSGSCLRRRRDPPTRDS